MQWEKKSAILRRCNRILSTLAMLSAECYHQQPSDVIPVLLCGLPLIYYLEYAMNDIKANVISYLWLVIMKAGKRFAKYDHIFGLLFNMTSCVITGLYQEQ